MKLTQRQIEVLHYALMRLDEDTHEESEYKPNEVKELINVVSNQYEG